MMPFSDRDDAHPEQAKLRTAVFRWVGRHLLRPHGMLYQTAFAAGAVVLSTGARFALDGVLPFGFPFVTFFVAVLVTLIGAGLRAGIAVTLICGLISWYYFVPPLGSVALDSGSVVAMLFYALITGAQIFFAAAAAFALRALDDSRRANADLARSRELMFSELQHRVSNNLATVAALLRMQSARAADPEVKQALGEARQRIQTIARLQRSLHSPDLQDIEASGFLNDLAREALEAAHLDRVPAITSHADALRLTRDQAVPVGLIVSELLMNAVEHGRPVQGDAVVRLELRTAPDPAGEGRLVTLEVVDNGPGLPADFDPDTAKSLGLSIARQFAEQLGGNLTMEQAPQGGTLSRLEFPA
jgi:two-component sensor histidine kinase